MPFKNQNIGDRILAQIVKAFEDTNIQAYYEFKETIESEVFFWDRMTRRSNGSTVFTPRDIVDTGEFRDSQDLVPVSPYRVEHIWTADHAPRILFGFERSDGSDAPERDWMTATLERWDIREDFKANLRKRLKEL